MVTVDKAQQVIFVFRLGKTSHFYVCVRNGGIEMCQGWDDHFGDLD